VATPPGDQTYFGFCLFSAEAAQRLEQSGLEGWLYIVQAKSGTMLWIAWEFGAVDGPGELERFLESHGADRLIPFYRIHLLPYEHWSGLWIGPEATKDAGKPAEEEVGHGA
jgi:hypothetical protein